MTTIDRVQLLTKPYSDVIELAVNEMLKTYSYAPYDDDIAIGAKHVGEETAILLKQAALLTPGQSTEVRELQSQTIDVPEARSRYELSNYIYETTGARFVISTGDKMQIDVKAQAHRHNDGCTIHTSFDVKYGGTGRMVGKKIKNSFYREEDIESELHSFMYDPFDTLLEQTGITKLEENMIEFVKKLRDNDLTSGINLSSLSDEQIEDHFKYSRYANPHAYIVRFLIEHSGLNTVDFLEKWMSIVDPTARFDLSQLSFHFEYDIEFDEETFQSYFKIDSDEEYTAKVNEQARLDKAKANADIVKPKVLAKLEEVLSDYDTDDREFDLEELAEQIAECRSRVEVFDEIDDGDDNEFFSMCDEFAKDSTYVVHTYDGGCSYDLIGEQKDEHIYSFEFGKYLNTVSHGYTFVIIDGGEPLDIDGNSFKSSDAFDLLASATHCSVLELPHRLVGNGYKDFDKETLLSASDESEIYDWLDSNIYAGDIVDILEEEELIEVIAGEYSKTLNKFEIDFSDCFE